MVTADGGLDDEDMFENDKREGKNERKGKKQNRARRQPPSFSVERGSSESEKREVDGGKQGIHCSSHNCEERKKTRTLSLFSSSESSSVDLV